MGEHSGRLEKSQCRKITVLESCTAVWNRVRGIIEALKEASLGVAADELMTGADTLVTAAEERAQLRHTANTMGGVSQDMISNASTRVANAANAVKDSANSMLRSTLPPEVQAALSDIVSDVNDIVEKTAPNR